MAGFHQPGLGTPVANRPHLEHQSQTGHTWTNTMVGKDTPPLPQQQSVDRVSGPVPPCTLSLLTPTTEVPWRSLLPNLAL